VVLDNAADLSVSAGNCEDILRLVEYDQRLLTGSLVKLTWQVEQSQQDSFAVGSRIGGDARGKPACGERQTDVPDPKQRFDVRANATLQRVGVSTLDPHNQLTDRQDVLQVNQRGCHPRLLRIAQQLGEQCRLAVSSQVGVVLLMLWIRCRSGCGWWRLREGCVIWSLGCVAGRRMTLRVRRSWSVGW